ncbi:MAG TPA: helix-hairpin-helix domain-containing protein, partial [Phototrophicaceae bacterium]|nr:helix-hairpin-helix domain-containing protein [Phototrophicaceae bacterium]
MTTSTITGIIERVTYFGVENGYSVLKVKPDQRIYDAQARDGTITVVGVMPELAVGESVQFSGQWIDDKRYGRQLRVETVTPIAPSSLTGIRSYLASGIVKGIGEATAAKIVDHFGMQTFDVLNNNPERLADVPGLKTSLVPKLIRAWADNVGVRQIMIFLQQYGVSSRMAKRIYDHLGNETIARVRDDPYSLAADVFGIGFIKADQIARNMGLAPDAKERLRAGLYYALNQMALDGHTYAPREELVATACKLLQIDEENQSRLSALLDMQLFTDDLRSDEFVVDGEIVKAIYLPQYHKSEIGATKRLRTLVETPSKITTA